MSCSSLPVPKPELHQQTDTGWGKKTIYTLPLHEWVFVNEPYFECGRVYMYRKLIWSRDHSWKLISVFSPPEEKEKKDFNFGLDMIWHEMSQSVLILSANHIYQIYPHQLHSEIHQVYTVPTNDYIIKSLYGVVVDEDKKTKDQIKIRVFQKSTQQWHTFDLHLYILHQKNCVNERVKLMELECQIQSDLVLSSAPWCLRSSGLSLPKSEVIVNWEELMHRDVL